MQLFKAMTTLVLAASSASAQFQFFDSFFGQQQGHPGNSGVRKHNDGRGTLQHGGDWYKDQFTQSHCAPGEFVCPSTLECVQEPTECACPHTLVRCDLGRGQTTCVSQSEGRDVCAEVQKMHSAL